jgi:hypothetical protein
MYIMLNNIAAPAALVVTVVGATEFQRRVEILVTKAAGIVARSDHSWLQPK